MMWSMREWSGECPEWAWAGLISCPVPSARNLRVRRTWRALIGRGGGERHPPDLGREMRRERMREGRWTIWRPVLTLPTIFTWVNLDWQNSTQTQLRFRLGAGANFLIEGLWNYEYNVMMRWMIMMNHVSALPWGHPNNRISPEQRSSIQNTKTCKDKYIPCQVLWEMDGQR